MLLANLSVRFAMAFQRWPPGGAPRRCARPLLGTAPTRACPGPSGPEGNGMGCFDVPTHAPLRRQRAAASPPAEITPQSPRETSEAVLCEYTLQKLFAIGDT